MPLTGKAGRYGRLRAQLAERFGLAADSALARGDADTDAPDHPAAAVRDPVARMATAAALLHHKFPTFSWTGFYRLLDGDLVVGPYQGAVACEVLARGQGVCWAAVSRGAPVVVPDVHAFPGHIACDPRSNAEVVVPVRAADGEVVGVLDVDSEQRNAFDETDAAGLAAIAVLIYAPPGRV